MSHNLSYVILNRSSILPCLCMVQISALGCKCTVRSIPCEDNFRPFQAAVQKLHNYLLSCWSFTVLSQEFTVHHLALNLLELLAKFLYVGGRELYLSSDCEMPNLQIVYLISSVSGRYRAKNGYKFLMDRGKFGR